MGTTWQCCLAFVSVFIYFFILQLCLSLSKIKINVHNLRLIKQNIPAKYTHALIYEMKFVSLYFYLFIK